MTYKELVDSLAFSMPPAIVPQIGVMVSLAEEYLWHCLEANFMRAETSFPVEAGTQDYEISASLYPLRIISCLLDDSSLEALSPQLFDSLTDEGTPEAYCYRHSSRTLRLDKIPVESGTLYVNYWRRWPKLTYGDDETTNPLLGDVVHLLRLKVLSLVPTQEGLIASQQFFNALREFNAEQNYNYSIGLKVKPNDVL